MSSNGLAFFEVWVDDTVRMLFLTNEDPSVSGVRLRLWTLAASGEIGPVGVLPQDDEQLARWGNVSLEQWREMKPRITGSWIDDDGNWVIRRLVQAGEKHEKFHEKQSQKAVISWRKRRATKPAGSQGKAAAGATARAKPHAAANATADAGADATAYAAADTTACATAKPRHMPRQCSPSPSQRDLTNSCLSPETLCRNEGQPKARPDAAQDSCSLRDSGGKTRTGQDPGRDNGGEPRQPREPRYTADHLERLDKLRRQIRASPVLGGQADAVDRVLAKHVASRLPFQTLKRGLMAVIENRPPLAAAYLAAILRAESGDKTDRGTSRMQPVAQAVEAVTGRVSRAAG